MGSFISRIILVSPCFCILLPLLFLPSTPQPLHVQYNEHYQSKINEILYTLVKSMAGGKICYVVAADGWKFEVENPDTVVDLGTYQISGWVGREGGR